MRYTSIVVGLLFGLLLSGGSLLKGCGGGSEPKTEKKVQVDGGSSEKSVTKDGGGTQKDAPPVRRSGPCKPGNKINACTGSGKCIAQRDCDAISGKDLPGMCYKGLCVPDPVIAAKTEKGKIDLSCIANPPSLPKGPEKTTWWGPVETFGLDSNTTNVTVEVFDYAADPDLKKPLASQVSELPKKNATCSSKCAADQVCFYGQCVKEQTSDGQEIGYFAFKDLPTNKLLVIRTTGPNLVSTIQYNRWFPADKVKKAKVDGKEIDVFKERAFAVTVLTKGLIPPTAGIRLPNKSEAVLAGEIHDCKGQKIEGAMVSISSTPLKLAYFNGKGDNPDPDQEWSNKDGIYTALNIKVVPPGDFIMRVVAKVNGKNQLVGQFKAKLFAEGVSIVTTTPWYPGLK